MPPVIARSGAKRQSRPCRRRGPPPYTPELEAFWAAYPRRRPNPKPEAAVAFDKALGLREPRVTAETLVAAATRYAEECRRQKIESAYIPHARTWLNKRRYLDYLEPSPLEQAPAGSMPQGDPRLHEVARHITATEYATWIAPLEVSTAGPDVLAIVAPDPTHRDWVRNHYGDLMRLALGHVPEYRSRPYCRRSES